MGQRFRIKQYGLNEIINEIIKYYSWWWDIPLVSASESSSWAMMSSACFTVVSLDFPFNPSK